MNKIFIIYELILKLHKAIKVSIKLIRFLIIEKNSIDRY